MQNEAMHITFHAHASTQNQRFKQAEGRRAMITFRFDLFSSTLDKIGLDHVSETMKKI